MNGAIRADGANGGTNGTAEAGGGGAGGAIWIEADTIVGAGQLSANGGVAGDANPDGGGGGGGRIALYTAAAPTVAAIQAHGGWGNQYGGAGTIYTKLDAETYGDLLLDNAGNTGAITDLPLAGFPAFGDLTVTQGSILDVAGGTTIQAVDGLVDANGVVTLHPAGTMALFLDLTLEISGDLTVTASGLVHADGRGYDPRSGPGAGGDAGNTGGGGAHGGDGGRSSEGATGGHAYDSPTRRLKPAAAAAPTSMGTTPRADAGGVRFD